MAAVINEYKVIYHFEQGGKKSGPDYIDYLQASASDFTTLKGVLSSNSRLRPGTLVIDSVTAVNHGESALA